GSRPPQLILGLFPLLDRTLDTNSRFQPSNGLSTGLHEVTVLHRTSDLAHQYRCPTARLSVGTAVGRALLSHVCRNAPCWTRSHHGPRRFWLGECRHAV